MTGGSPLETDVPPAPADVDVLIPTYRRPGALAVTLAGLAAQAAVRLRIVISDQSPAGDGARSAEIEAMIRVLTARGHRVERHVHLPRRGLAEHRQSLLDRTTASACLFLDDDVWVEPDLVLRLLRALRRAGCGFVGSAVIGLSFAQDVRPEQQAIELWPDDRPEPELLRPGGPGWDRHRLHNAANVWHVGLAEDPGHDRLYKVAWVGGCVLYDTSWLRAAGGFSFWRELPTDHCGEDVLAQLRVMARAGGAGLLPSGAFHLELPTTVTARPVDAPLVLGLT